MEKEIEIEIGFKERVLQYYFLNRNKVHAITAGIIVVSALSIAYLTAGPSASEATKAKTLFNEWKQTPADQKLTKEMRIAIKKIPGLERGVEAEMAQTMITAGQINAAEAIAKECIERLREESPDHASFASASLLVEKGEYQKALEVSVALKERLKEGSSLYACNLLRIGFLHAQVGNLPGELAAWEEVKGVLEMEGTSNAAQFLKGNFGHMGGQNGYSLADYISQREKAIH